MIPNQLMPMAILLTTAIMIVSLRRLRGALIGRRARRAAVEAAEYARITGWIRKLRTEDVGPAITRNEKGELVLFKGLRRYMGSGRRTRRGRRA